MANQVIKTFSKTGKVVSGVRRAGVATSPLGKLDPNTGVVWQRPRKKLNEVVGSTVVVTNPNYTTDKIAQRTRSIGAGGVPQQKRNM